MGSEEILASLSGTSDETEFYSPLPAGYQPGRTKYVIVFGTVMSGLGKGIFSSSLAKCLKDKGLAVAPIKLEGYLNIDSGTLNPYRHGEVFVLDDGMETDMDLGTYERMLDQDLSRLHFTTSGQIFASILKKERQGSYLGRDVQMIPHVTGEVKMRLRELAAATRPDVVFVEIGGTVGDVENAYFIEAVRELAFEEGPDSVAFVALTYIISPPKLGEQKSKAAQLGIKGLMAAGIQPQIIACRGRDPISRKVLEKLALYSNVPISRLFSMHDCDSIYLIPEMVAEAGLDEVVIDILRLRDRVKPQRVKAARQRWNEFVGNIRQVSGAPVRIGIIGKYTTLRDSYASIIHAVEHAGAANRCKPEIVWIDTSDLTAQGTAEKLKDLHGIIVPGGFGTRGAEGKIGAIQYARENKVPYLGICYGFQMAVIEYARNVCGLTGANSVELDPQTPHPVIDMLPEQKRIEGLGGNMRLGGRDVEIRPGTLAAELFGGNKTRLRFRHRYEVDPRYIEQLERAGLIFSGKAPEHPIMQVLELPRSVHPYFIGTQAHPEFQSRPLRPQPMFAGLIAAAIQYAK